MLAVYRKIRVDLMSLREKIGFMEINVGMSLRANISSVGRTVSFSVSVHKEMSYALTDW